MAVLVATPSNVCVCVWTELTNTSAPNRMHSRNRYLIRFTLPEKPHIHKCFRVFGIVVDQLVWWWGSMSTRKIYKKRGVYCRHSAITYNTYDSGVRARTQSVFLCIYSVHMQFVCACDEYSSLIFAVL